MRQILIIEDELDLAKLIAEELQLAGCGAHVTTDGMEALDYLRDADPLPDLILLDLQMPIMDGYRFRAEQRRHPRWRVIPVIAMSAVRPRRSASGNDIDVQAWLAKPFDLEHLLTLVRRPRLQL